MIELDTIVIGAGLFGSIIAKSLRKAGKSVLTFDASFAEAGSAPAAGLMRPTWFSGLGKAVYDPALQLIDNLYGLETIKFETMGKLPVNVHWCAPSKILQAPDIRAKVKLRPSSRCVSTSEGDFFAKQIIVAAGVWTPLLIPGLEVGGLAGAAYLWPEQKIDKPFIKVWAPYKQMVAFNRGDGLWVGDGLAIMRSNWCARYNDATLARCARAVGSTETPKRLFGIRPYVKGVSPCLLKEVTPGVWAATGGAKNGTVAAAWCAYKLSQQCD
jgi:glycine/D-amino acid oxidase-like deaminating enzyme